MVTAATCDDTGGNNTADCTQHSGNQGNCELQDDGLGGIDAKCVYNVGGSTCDDVGGNSTVDCTQHDGNQSNCEAQDDGLGVKCVFTPIGQNLV